MSKRQYNIDNLRGFITCLVVMGHVLLGFEGLYNYTGAEELFRSTLLRYIYSFHMPIFFALSGYFFSYEKIPNISDIKNFVVHKFITLMIPYFLFSIIYWCIKKMLASILLAPISIKQLLYIPIIPIEFMWYLYALFFINCFAEILLLVVKNKYIIFLISILILFIPNCDIYIIDIIKGYFIYFCLGHIISIIKQTRTKITVCCIAGALDMILFFGSSQIAFISTYFYNIIVAICGSLFWSFLFLLLSSEKKILFLYKLGRNGMPIYLMNVIVVGGIRTVLNRMGIVGFVPNVVIGFFGATILCYVVYVFFIKKIKILNFIFYPRFNGRI